MIGTLGEISPYMLVVFCLNMKGRVLLVYIVVVVGLHVDHYGRSFLPFKVGKTQFRGLCLFTSEPGIRSTIKIWNRKRFRNCRRYEIHDLFWPLKRPEMISRFRFFITKKSSIPWRTSILFFWVTDFPAIILLEG